MPLDSVQGIALIIYVLTREVIKVALNRQLFAQALCSHCLQSLILSYAGKVTIEFLPVGKGLCEEKIIQVLKHKSYSANN